MIDSHCHLDHELLLSDLESVLNRSKKVGIEKLLTISTTLKSYKNILKIINIDPIIFGTIGIHPHETQNENFNTDFLTQEAKKNEKIIGIGETGLDFYYNNSNKKNQINSFYNHLEASLELSYPLIVHSRNAEIESLEIFNNYKNKNIKILMHCFTGTKDFAKKLIDKGSYFSASGIITFKNSSELQETFKYIPNDKILIETDCPFLAPEPMRGKKNEPSYVKYTLEKLSIIKNIHFDEMNKITTNNFNRLFFNK